MNHIDTPDMEHAEMLRICSYSLLQDCAHSRQAACIGSALTRTKWRPDLKSTVYVQVKGLQCAAVRIQAAL